MEPKPEKMTFCSKTSALGPSDSGEQCEEELELAALRNFSSSCSSLGKGAKSWEPGRPQEEPGDAWGQPEGQGRGPGASSLSSSSSFIALLFSFIPCHFYFISLLFLLFNPSPL